MDDQNFIASKKSIFLLKFKIHEILFYKIQELFCFVLQCIERKMFTIEIDDGREVP